MRAKKPASNGFGPADCKPCGAKRSVTYRYDGGWVYECRACGHSERRSESTGKGLVTPRVVTGGHERRSW